jgi:hypothetical protein
VNINSSLKVRTHNTNVKFQLKGLIYLGGTMYNNSRQSRCLVSWWTKSSGKKMLLWKTIRRVRKWWITVFCTWLGARHIFNFISAQDSKCYISVNSASIDLKFKMWAYIHCILMLVVYYVHMWSNIKFIFWHQIYTLCNATATIVPNIIQVTW